MSIKSAIDIPFVSRNKHSSKLLIMFDFHFVCIALSLYIHTSEIKIYIIANQINVYAEKLILTQILYDEHTNKITFNKTTPP